MVARHRDVLETEAVPFVDRGVHPRVPRLTQHLAHAKPGRERAVCSQVVGQDLGELSTRRRPVLGGVGVHDASADLVASHPRREARIRRAPPARCVAGQDDGGQPLEVGVE